MAKLTKKQGLFVDEYLIDLNATQAYIRAGYKARGNVAEAAAARLLRNVKVQSHIHERMKEREKRTEITQDKVLQELAKIGFSDMRTFTVWNNQGVSLVDSETLTPDQSACVAEVSQTVTESGGSIKFKLHDKVSALEKIGKHLGMFTDKIEHSGNIDSTVEIVIGVEDYET